MWREHLETREVDDAQPWAGALFTRCFGHDIPQYPRHFVLLYWAAPHEKEAVPEVVGYAHQMPFEDIYLGGGMCVDERAYRRFPRLLYQSIRNAGGLATIVARDSIAMLGDSPAAFGHVGEPRARQADLRTGFQPTDDPHLMVFWRRPLSDSDKQRLIEKAKAYGPF
jgi:hypothetical protein